MKLANKPRLGVVVPVYNESDTIERCLNAIASQTIKPHEVIVVDNNCTDDTIAKAKLFKKLKVTVVKEPVQGLIAARNRGFGLVKGDIICRVDADTFPEPNWLETIQTAFSSNPKLSAVGGMVEFYDAPFQGFLTRLFKFVAYSRMFHKNNIVGNNMAIRREAWKKIAGKCCETRGIVEDVDLAMHAAEAGMSMEMLPDLMVRSSARRWKVGFVNYYKNLLPWAKVLRIHGLNPVSYWLLVVAVFPLATVLTRPLRWAILAYNEQTGKMSLKQLLSDRQPDRVIPA